MGLRPGLPQLRPTRSRAARLAASLQLASPTRRDKVPNTNQPPRPSRGQPDETPQLGRLRGELQDLAELAGPGTGDAQEALAELDHLFAAAGVEEREAARPHGLLGDAELAVLAQLHPRATVTRRQRLRRDQPALGRPILDQPAHRGHVLGRRRTALDAGFRTIDGKVAHLGSPWLFAPQGRMSRARADSRARVSG